MTERYLSIDIGFKNPSFVVIDYEEKKKSITNIFIYQNIIINKIKDVSFFLNYFISKKINKVIIEKQFIGKNINLMYYIYGFFNSRDIDVIIKNPIAYLLNKTYDKKTTRKLKKTFSVDLLNKILYNNNLNYQFIYLNNDICDSINICLNYLHNKYNCKKKEESFLNNFSIKILNIKFISLKIVDENT